MSGRLERTAPGRHEDQAACSTLGAQRAARDPRRELGPPSPTFPVGAGNAGGANFLRFPREHFPKRGFCSPRRVQSACVLGRGQVEEELAGGVPAPGWLIIGLPSAGRGRAGEEPAGAGPPRVDSRWSPVRGAGPGGGGACWGRGADWLPIGRPSAGRGRAGRETPPGVQEPVESVEWSYQRGQLVACPCASAPAQFNGHCPPAPLFRRRPLPAGLGWGGRQETLRAEAQTPRPPWALGRGLRARPGARLVSAQPFPLGLRVPVCRVNGRARTVTPGKG